MQRTLILDTSKKIKQKVLVQGWVQVVRDHGKIVFLELRDRSALLQVVVSDKVAKGLNIKPEYVLSIIGQINKRPTKMVRPDHPTGTVELQAEKVSILSQSKPLPFDTGGPELKLELPTLLDYRSLSLRHPKVRAIFKLQAVILKTFREFLTQKGFTEISVPTIVPTATEGGAEVFPIKYFDQEAYLAQSPQFFKQIMVGIFERVFTVSHAYRAEPSVTSRHMTEYVGLDAEMGFIDSWLDVLNMADELVKAIFKTVESECHDILKQYKTTVPKTISKTPRLKLKEALDIIYQRTGRDNRHEPDLEPEDEREICRWAHEEKGSEILFITHYPTKKRPMYTYPDSDNPAETLSFDLIGRGVEWITGGQRINDYQQLVLNIKKWGCDPADFANPYLQAFKYGMPPEGGFCLGLERITQNTLALANIREASLFPRDMTRIDYSLSQKDDQKKT
jgi:nondiscriminating aspartyl-tRNA synthetase